MTQAKVKNFNLDAFAGRQFNEHYSGGNKIDSKFKKDFADKVNELYDTGKYKLHDGYAPFCKHLFLPNWTGAEVSVLPITVDNEHFIRSAYQSRRAEELPVLARWFPRELVSKYVTEAKYLDIILYSREQIKKESEDLPTGEASEENVDDIPWGIISIKAQDEDHETPMQPITAMRNALGRDQGGSGVPIDIVTKRVFNTGINTQLFNNIFIKHLIHVVNFSTFCDGWFAIVRAILASFLNSTSQQERMDSNPFPVISGLLNSAVLDTPHVEPETPTVAETAHRGTMRRTDSGAGVVTHNDLVSDQLSALLLFYNLAVPDLKGDKKAVLNDFIR